MGRVMADCRRFESDAGCTLTIIGREEEVIDAAVAHAVAAHGHSDSPELRDQLRALLEPEGSYVAGERSPEPFPA
jgi:plasmid stability protein